MSTNLESQREISNLVQIAETIKQGDVPSNKQISKELREAEKFLAKDEVAASSREEEKTLRDARKLLEATNEALLQKNRNEEIQTFATHIKLVSEDKEFASTFVSDQAWEETREFLISLRSLMMSLYKSSNFRNVLWMMFKLMREVWFVQPGTTGKVREAFVDGHQPKKAATSISGDISDNMKNLRLEDLPEKDKNEIRLHFKQLLYEINQHPDSSDAIPKFIGVWSMLSDEILSTREKNPELIKIQQEAKDVVEGIVGQSISLLLEKMRIAAKVINHDEALRHYLRELKAYFERGLDYPDLIDDDEYLDEGYEYLRRGREFAYKYNEEPALNDALDEAIKLMQNLKNDAHLTELQYRANKFLDNFTTRNAKGKTEVNTDLIAAMRAHIIPLLLSRVKNIPVPGFNVHDEDFEYLKADDLCVTVSDILPDNIFIHTSNDISLAIQDFASQSAALSHSWLQIRIEGIRLSVPDFHFAFKRRKMIKISDEGRASLHISGNGLSLLIKYKFRQDITNMLGEAEVSANIDRLQIVISEAKHKALLKMGLGLLRKRIKTNIEQLIQDQIRNLTKELGETLSKTINSLPKGLPANLDTVKKLLDK